MIHAYGLLLIGSLQQLSRLLKPGFLFRRLLTSHCTLGDVLLEGSVLYHPELVSMRWLLLWKPLETVSVSTLVVGCLWVDWVLMQLLRGVPNKSLLGRTWRFHYLVYHSVLMRKHCHYWSLWLHSSIILSTTYDAVLVLIWQCRWSWGINRAFRLLSHLLWEKEVIWVFMVLLIKCLRGRSLLLEDLLACLVVLRCPICLLLVLLSNRRWIVWEHLLSVLLVVSTCRRLHFDVFRVKDCYTSTSLDRSHCAMRVRDPLIVNLLRIRLSRYQVSCCILLLFKMLVSVSIKPGDIGLYVCGGLYSSSGGLEMSLISHCLVSLTSFFWHLCLESEIFALTTAAGLFGIQGFLTIFTRSPEFLRTSLLLTVWVERLLWTGGLCILVLRPTLATSTVTIAFGAGLIHSGRCGYNRSLISLYGNSLKPLVQFWVSHVKMNSNTVFAVAVDRILQVLHLLLELQLQLWYLLL